MYLVHGLDSLAEALRSWRTSQVGSLDVTLEPKPRHAYYPPTGMHRTTPSCLPLSVSLLQERGETEQTLWGGSGGFAVIQVKMETGGNL